MFRCHFCATSTPARVKATRLPVETRLRIYAPSSKAHLFRRDGKLMYNDDPGGAGYEIVREVLACPACAARERRSLAELCPAEPHPVR
jgi:hypothetical protein